MWTALSNALQASQSQVAAGSADVVMGEADSDGAGVASRQEGARGGCGALEAIGLGSPQALAANTKGQGLDTSAPRTSATVSSRTSTESANLDFAPCGGRAAESLQVEKIMISDTLLLGQCHE
jgi:hypothetical protein